MKRNLYYIFLLSILLSGCRKYEENPLINLRSKNERIVGQYNIAFYSVNGIDSTAAVNDSLKLNGVNPSIEFFRSDGQEEIGNSWFEGKWHLSRNKKYLNISIEYYTYGIGPFISPGPIDWTITKLTENQIHLKLNKNNNNYILQLHQR